MLKKLLLAASLIALAFSANAQVATPQLDAGFATYGGAAAGWRFNSTVNLVGLIADGKAELDGTEEGDIVAGFNAKGPDESGSIPFLLAALRGETWGAELYTNITNGLNTDIEMEFDTPVGDGIDEYNVYKEEKEKKLNLAYVLGETLSIGIGYSSINLTTKSISKGSNYLATTVPFNIYGTLDNEEVVEKTTNAIGVTASLRLAEIFFLAAGMEQVTENGTHKTDRTVVITVPAPSTIVTDKTEDYVENSWTNTLIGFGIMLGEPDDVQFRAEYASITSPESEKEAEGDKLASAHHATTHTFATVEVKWNNILLAYQSEVETEAELNDEESETKTTLMGLGWQPLEGFTASLYSFNRVITSETALGEVKVNPVGYRIFLGYNF